uniref:Uncharacterized protein n=1 Tax=Pyxicephalus adspersus TaxID=30357 RepID=A0AAV2ZXS4_PYXAD|nr:TPA: hypothetical protein GDO54_004098 [Pyxicephalus adspersus]
MFPPPGSIEDEMGTVVTGRTKHHSATRGAACCATLHFLPHLDYCNIPRVLCNAQRTPVTDPGHVSFSLMADICTFFVCLSLNHCKYKCQQLSH